MKIWIIAAALFSYLAHAYIAFRLKKLPTIGYLNVSKKEIGITFGYVFLFVGIFSSLYLSFILGLTFAVAFIINSLLLIYQEIIGPQGKIVPKFIVYVHNMSAYSVWILLGYHLVVGIVQ